MSFLEMLDVVNERADREGRGADRLRPRLPRGHLRHVRLMINGVRARPASAARRPASCTCAASRTATTIDDRAVARAAPSRSSRTSSSTAARSTASSQAGGYISRQHRRRARRATPSRPQARRRRGDGRRRLHRLRRLRGRLPERLGDRSSPRPRSRTSACCRRASPSATTRVLAHGRRRWTRRASAAAPTTASARRPARRRSRMDTISRMNRDLLGALQGRGAAQELEKDPGLLTLHARAPSGRGRPGQNQTSGPPHPSQLAAGPWPGPNSRPGQGLTHPSHAQGASLWPGPTRPEPAGGDPSGSPPVVLFVASHPWPGEDLPAPRVTQPCD